MPVRQKTKKTLEIQSYRLSNSITFFGLGIVYVLLFSFLFREEITLSWGDKLTFLSVPEWYSISLIVLGVLFFVYSYWQYRLASKGVGLSYYNSVLFGYRRLFSDPNIGHLLQLNSTFLFIGLFTIPISPLFLVEGAPVYMSHLLLVFGLVMCFFSFLASYKLLKIRF